MLRISRLADYAIIVMAAIDKQSEIISREKLCEITRIPPATVKKLLRMLANDGLVVAERGLKGGYRLSQSSNDISVADIVEAVDGKIAITECSHARDEPCEYSAICEVQSNWSVVNQHVYQLLDSISLEVMHTQQFSNQGLPLENRIMSQK